MTDENCGWPTTSGDGCQNPAGEDGTCWIPSHGDDNAENPHGRPSLLEEYEQEIYDAARQGLTYEGIARVAGIGVSTLHDWRDEHADFSESLERARSKAERDLIKDVNPEFVLERSYNYVKTEKREIDMDADVDSTHDVTADFITFETDDTEDDVGD